MTLIISRTAVESISKSSHRCNHGITEGWLHVCACQASLVDVFEHYPAAPPPSPPPEPAREPSPPPVHYETQYPFVPPDVPIFYDPPRPEAPPVQAVYVPQHAEARPYVHMETFSEPPMTHSEQYPKPDAAYEARESVQALTRMAPPREAAAPAAAAARDAQRVEERAPVVEEEIARSVR